MTYSEIDFEELNRHLGQDNGTNDEEKQTDSGKQEKRVNLSLTPEQLNEFIKAQKAKETQQQSTQETSQNPQQETGENKEQEPKQEPEQKPQKQYKRAMTDKRREAIKKAQENSPNHKRKKEKEAQAKKEAESGQNSQMYQQPVQNQQYYPQPNPGQVPTQQPPAVHPYQPLHNQYQQPAQAQVQQYPSVAGYDPNVEIQMPPQHKLPQPAPAPQLNYLDHQSMTGYPEPEYYQPNPQPVQDYNLLEYLRNNTQNPSYNYSQQIPRLTRLNPYSANARQDDVISSLGFKMEDSKPKGIARPRPNTSAGRPGGMREEPVQNQGVDPLSFFK